VTRQELILRAARVVEVDARCGCDDESWESDEESDGGGAVNGVGDDPYAERHPRAVTIFDDLATTQSQPDTPRAGLPSRAPHQVASRSTNCARRSCDPEVELRTQLCAPVAGVAEDSSDRSRGRRVRWLDRVPDCSGDHAAPDGPGSHSIGTEGIGLLGQTSSATRHSAALVVSRLTGLPDWCSSRFRLIVTCWGQTAAHSVDQLRARVRDQ
jgi:hypothetical protein